MEVVENRIAFIVDEEGYIVDSIVVSSVGEYVDENTIAVMPAIGTSFYKMKWDGEKWIEGKSQAEFDEDNLLNSLIPSQDEITNAEFDIKVLNVLLEVGAI